MKKLALILFGCALGFTSFAQQDSLNAKQLKKQERRDRIEAIIKQEEDGVITYTRHTAFGIKLTNDGYGGFIEIGRPKSVKKSWLFQLDIAERKHPNTEPGVKASSMKLKLMPLMMAYAINKNSNTGAENFL